MLLTREERLRFLYNIERWSQPWTCRLCWHQLFIPSLSPQAWLCCHLCLLHPSQPWEILKLANWSNFFTDHWKLQLLSHTILDCRNLSLYWHMPNGQCVYLMPSIVHMVQGNWKPKECAGFLSTWVKVRIIHIYI